MSKGEMDIFKSDEAWKAHRVTCMQYEDRLKRYAKDYDLLSRRNRELEFQFKYGTPPMWVNYIGWFVAVGIFLEFAI